jgi:hypothetical protein
MIPGNSTSLQGHKLAVDLDTGTGVSLRLMLLRVACSYSISSLLRSSHSTLKIISSFRDLVDQFEISCPFCTIAHILSVKLNARGKPLSVRVWGGAQFWKSVSSVERKRPYWLTVRPFVQSATTSKNNKNFGKSFRKNSREKIHFRATIEVGTHRGQSPRPCRRVVGR